MICFRYEGSVDLWTSAWEYGASHVTDKQRGSFTLTNYNLSVSFTCPQLLSTGLP